MLSNAGIAEIFYEISERLDMEDGNFFKSRAMRNAAETIEGLPEPLAEYRDKLEELPGIGKAIAEKIIELLDTGKLEYLEKLRTKMPVDLPKLTAVPGLGPKKIKLLYETLNIKNVDELKAAAIEGKLKKIRGMGEKTEKALLDAISFSENSKRFPLWEAREIALGIIEALIPDAKIIEVCGSVRRWKETIGDIDILAVSDSPEKMMAAFSSLESKKKVLAKGNTKSAIMLKNNMHVDLRVIPAESYGAALQYFTGSQSHNIELRKIAKAKGLRLSEYGLFDGEKMIAGKNEAGIYSSLGLDFIPPELRENRGEIDAASAHKLPRLVQLSDIKGDLHMHSKWSDGRSTISELAKECIKRGYQYMAVTDHVGNLKIARALTIDELKEQWREIDKLNSKLRPFRILKGAEVQIKSDGTIDFPEDMLAKLEIVVASIHHGFNGTEAEMTMRICRAMENKYVTFIGHPTGRMINTRPSYSLDISQVFKKASDTKKMMEINSHPVRLDLNDTLTRDAINHTMVVINTDSHSLEQLDAMRFGVEVARRGWCTAKDILNTRSLRELLEVLPNRP